MDFVKLVFLVWSLASTIVVSAAPLGGELLGGTVVKSLSPDESARLNEMLDQQKTRMAFSNVYSVEQSRALYRSHFLGNKELRGFIAGYLHEKIATADFDLSKNLSSCLNLYGLDALTDEAARTAKQYDADGMFYGAVTLTTGVGVKCFGAKNGN